MKRSNESGSHLVAGVLVVLFLAVAGYAGYRVYMMRPSATNGAAVPTTTATVTPPTQITDTAQLNQASSALSSASAQLNTDLNDTSLNTDLNSML